MSILQELLQIANQLSKYQDYNPPGLDALEKTANSLRESWSGSWLGYQSRVYYADFQPLPPEVTFSKEWGLSREMNSDLYWEEHTFKEVVQFIVRQTPGITSNDLCDADSQEATEAFKQAQASTLSLVHANYNLENNKFMAKLVAKIESLEISTKSDFIQPQRPSNQMSSDTRAIAEGWCIPPHIDFLAMIHTIKAPFKACKDLKKQIVILANHIQNLEQNTMQKGKLGNSTSARIGNKIFIGHGHSPAWREFKDFIVDRLELNWDEFNRVSSAGIPNTERLGQMLDQACMAFLVMTAEDEDAEGKLHARENVIHEAGLFQDRLGFERAIILLEEGCEEFSNIEGLGQIRFPKGNISAIFEEVRRVLKREGIIE